MDKKAASKRRVLVVDDEPGIGKVLRIRLGLSGYEVITTTSGAEFSVETKGKILLIDDEPAIFKVFSIKLRVLGHEVITALSGEVGFELSDSAKPDIMLLEIILPGIDGFQVLEKLRRRPGACNEAVRALLI